MGRKIYDPSQIDEGIVRARSLRFPRMEYLLLDDFLYPVAEIPFHNVGTIAEINLRGGAMDALSGALAGNQAIIDLNPAVATWFTANRDFIFEARVRTLQTVALYSFIGLYVTRPTGAAPPVEPVNSIYFRRIDVGAAANWFAVCRAGGVETAVDTTILGNVNFHIFTIKRVGDVVEFQIDGVTRARITTNLPAVDVGLGVVLVTQAAVAKAFDIDYIFFSQER